MKRKQGDSKQCYESVDTGALIRAEDLPPFYRPISQYHGHIERNNGCEDVVEVCNSNHAFFPALFPPSEKSSSLGMDFKKCPGEKME